MGPPVNFIPLAPHHIYIGLMLVIIAITMIPHPIWRPAMFICFILGVMFIVDDFVEHTVTSDTPLCKLGNKLQDFMHDTLGVPQRIHLHYTFITQDGVKTEYNTTFIEDNYGFFDWILDYIDIVDDFSYYFDWEPLDEEELDPVY